MPPEAMKIAGPRAAGIDKGRRAAVARDLAGVDPERGAAPIDMRVQIDKPRRDDQAAHIDNLGAVAPYISPDGRNLAAAEYNIRDLVARIRRIDDPAASENEIRHAPAPALPQRGYPG